MPWPLPAPGEIADRAAAVYEGVPALAGIDARSPNTVATQNCRITELSATDVYLFQGYLAQELMPDTAQDNLARFGSIWGVPQLQPTAATGNAIFAGIPFQVIPADFEGYDQAGLIIETVNAGTLDGSGAGTLPVIAITTGSATDRAGGTVFTAVSPLAGLTSQTLTLDSSGLSGGTDLEDREAWRQRILARIRQPPGGGDISDYVQWAKAADDQVAYVSVIPGMGGLGNVGVIVGMIGPRVPTGGEITAIQAYIAALAPVTANVIVLACTLQPVSFTIHLNPDTTANRAAASVALALSFQQDASIGGTVYMSRIDNALASSDGEYSHERSVPSADVTMTALQLPTLSTVTFD